MRFYEYQNAFGWEAEVALDSRIAAQNYCFFLIYATFCATFFQKNSIFIPKHPLFVEK